MLVIIAEMLR